MISELKMSNSSFIICTWFRFPQISQDVNTFKANIQLTVTKQQFQYITKHLNKMLLFYFLFDFFCRMETINRNLQHMTPDQRRAFGSWFSKALPTSDIIRGHQSLIRDTGNLIAYLPFHNFQHLSPAQVTALWALTPGHETREASTLSVPLAAGHSGATRHILVNWKHR